MNSADVLPPEDRAEFERVLDEALRTARLTTGADDDQIEELRAMALRALPRIAVAAEAEYRQFAELRQALRPSRGPGATHASAAGSAASSAPSATPSAAPTSVAPGDSSGFGLAAMVAVLLPVLAAIAAVIFLLLGFALGLSDPEPSMARPMREVGLVFAALAGVGVLVAMAGLVIAAVRNGSRTAIRASRPRRGRGPRAEDVARAREAWRRALLEEGIMPFLRGHASAGDGVGASGEGEEDRRTPRLRFSSPDFSSPDFDSQAGPGGRGLRPRFSQPEFSGPEFSSPRFTSPEAGHEPADREEARVGRGYGRPAFGRPDFDSPDFDSPDFDGGAAPDDGSGEGGEETQRDAGAGARRFGQPDFARPDFSSPEFSSPADGGDRD